MKKRRNKEFFIKIDKVLKLSIVGLSAVMLGGCLKKEIVTEPTKDPKKIASMVESGDPMYCVMSSNEGGAVETWIKGEKTKVYSTGMVEGAGMGYMIGDSEWTYVWTEGEAKGTKYPAADEELENDGYDGEEFINEASDFDMKEELDQYMVDDYEYECNKENIPDSTFVPPLDVEFIDVMKEMEEKMGITVDDMGYSGGNLEDYKRE